MLYNEVIRYEAIHTLLIKNYVDTPISFNIFNEEMVKEINNNKENITKIIESFKNKKNKKISINFYRINTILDYKGLYNKYKELFKI